MSLQTYRWYHLVGTYDGQDMKVYVGGVLSGTKRVGALPVGNSSPLYFGYSEGSNYPYYLTGQLDEVRVWNYARTEAEIRSNMFLSASGTQAGLVGCWQFNEALSEQTVLDCSTNGNTGFLGWTGFVETSDPTRLASDLWASLAPVVVAQPLSQTAVIGGNVNLSVSVSGSQPLAYQWQKDGTNLAHFGRISGADSRTPDIDLLENVRFFSGSFLDGVA